MFAGFGGVPAPLAEASPPSGRCPPLQKYLRPSPVFCPKTSCILYVLIIYSIKGEPSLAASADRASRLRQALKPLVDDYQRQVDTLLPLRQLVKGSVYDLQPAAASPPATAPRTRDRSTLPP